MKRVHTAAPAAVDSALQNRVGEEIGRVLQALNSRFGSKSNWELLDEDSVVWSFYKLRTEEMRFYTHVRPVNWRGEAELILLEFLSQQDPIVQSCSVFADHLDIGETFACLHNGDKIELEDPYPYTSGMAS